MPTALQTIHRAPFPPKASPTPRDPCTLSQPPGCSDTTRWALAQASFSKENYLNRGQTEELLHPHPPLPFSGLSLQLRSLVLTPPCSLWVSGAGSNHREPLTSKTRGKTSCSALPNGLFLGFHNICSSAFLDSLSFGADMQARSGAAGGAGTSVSRSGARVCSCQPQAPSVLLPVGF